MPFSVAELCERQKIDLATLTERSGLDENRVVAIVMGRWTPSPDERRRIAEVLDIQADEVAWGHKTPIQHLYGHGPG